MEFLGICGQFSKMARNTKKNTHRKHRPSTRELLKSQRKPLHAQKIHYVIVQARAFPWDLFKIRLSN